VAVTLLLFYILLQNYINKRFTLIDLLPPFQAPVLSGVNITPTSQIHMAFMLILLMAENLKYKGGVTSCSMMSIPGFMETCRLVQGHYNKKKHKK
jgi:hypothetical protein